MNKIISMIMAALIAVSAGYLSGCSQETTTSPTEAVTVKKQTEENEIQTYLKGFTEGKNPLYGTWVMKEFDYVSYVFRNDGLAELVMDNEGDFTKLTIDEKAKTLSLAFVLGLNGTYNYSLSDDNKTLTLELDGKKYALQRQPDYNIAPNPPKNAEIDNDILGWWKSDGNQIYFFGSDGVMYSNTITMETGYTYSAKSGVIKAVYNYGGKVKLDIKYNIKGGKLLIEDQEFEKYTP